MNRGVNIGVHIDTHDTDTATETCDKELFTYLRGLTSPRACGRRAADPGLPKAQLQSRGLQAPDLRRADVQLVQVQRQEKVNVLAQDCQAGGNSLIQEPGRAYFILLVQTFCCLDRPPTAAEQPASLGPLTQVFASPRSSLTDAQSDARHNDWMLCGPVSLTYTTNRCARYTKKVMTRNT